MKCLSTYPTRSLGITYGEPPGAQGHQASLGGLCAEAHLLEPGGWETVSKLLGQPSERPAETRPAGWAGSGGRPRHPGQGGLSGGAGVGAEGWRPDAPPPHCCLPGCRTGGQSPPSSGLPGCLSVSLGDTASSEHPNWGCPFFLGPLGRKARSCVSVSSCCVTSHTTTQGPETANIPHQARGWLGSSADFGVCGGWGWGVTHTSGAVGVREQLRWSGQGLVCGRAGWVPAVLGGWDLSPGSHHG